jgi:hypothetical protein
MGAVATILQTSKVGPTKPDRAVLRTVSAKISDALNKYPDVPQVWQATGAFISYKKNGVRCIDEVGGPAL